MDIQWWARIEWKQTDSDFRMLLEREVPAGFERMNSGLEADAFMIHIAGERFVLKVWPPNSGPDLALQYKLLEALFRQGTAVSKPIARGTDERNRQVLLTEYGGVPVRRLNQEKLARMAEILIEIHGRSPAIEKEIPLPRREFAAHFFPGINDHPDLKDALVRLLEAAPDKQQCLIHGDYHMENILELGDRLTVIDWTNIQLGDPRYDMAWSTVLMRIYAGRKHGSCYRSELLARSRISVEELEAFEAIACLRWMLLNRTAGLPKKGDTVSQVRSLLAENRFLNGCRLLPPGE